MINLSADPLGDQFLLARPSVMQHPVEPLEETRQEPGGNHGWLGTAGLVVAGVIICLAFVDLTSGLPFFMPRSWYADRGLWYVLALCGLVLGIRFLRSNGAGEAASNLGPPGARFGRVVLYTRKGCHLCDEARHVLAEFAAYLPVVEEQDIDARHELAEQFSACVPVVEIDGKVRFRGRVEPALLRRLIVTARPPKGESNATNGTRGRSQEID